MPVQNSNFKIFARPDLATYLLQILIPATFNSLVCQKGQFTLQLCPRRWFVGKIFGYYTPKITIEIFTCPNRRFLGNNLSKRQVGQVLAKSLNITTWQAEDDSNLPCSASNVLIESSKFNSPLFDGVVGQVTIGKNFLIHFKFVYNLTFFIFQVHVNQPI